jgi:hypothetical protein
MTMTTPSYPGDRLVRRGSLRFALRDIGDDKRLLLLGDHWQTGAEVVLRTFDADESAYFKPGPLDEREHGPEWQIAEDADAHLFDPDAKDPPNRVGFTTSHPDYDHGCTIELERFTCAIFPGEREHTYRKVMVRGGNGFAVGQIMRYGGLTDEDPRVRRDAYAAERATEAARKDAEKREADEDDTYLRALPLSDLETEHARRADVEEWTRTAELRRNRSKKLLPVRRQEALDAEWTALQARIPCGATLLVPAKPRIPRTDSWSIRQFGTHEPGSPAYLVHVVAPLWHEKERPIRDREYQVMFDDAQGYSCHSAEALAEWVEKGYATTNYPAVELRRKFYGRVGSGIIGAPRAIVGGAAYYIGTKRYSSEVLVLDGESMNLCRSKKVRQLVENAHTWHTGRRYVVDAIAYREALPETDPERAKLPALRDQLAAGDAAKPKEIAAVNYEIPQIPCLTVAEVLATRTEEE